MLIRQGIVLNDQLTFTLLCLLFLTLFSVHVLSDPDEDLVSIEETIDVRSADPSEILDNLDPMSLDHSEDSGSTEPKLRPIGLIEQKRPEDEETSSTLNQNSTSSETKVDCTLVNSTESQAPGVQIVNPKRFLELVTPKGNHSTCALALFYYPWCDFSAKVNRDYNAIGKLFPQLNVIALDAYHHNSINMRYGLVGVPTILFFHNGKIVGKYTKSQNFTQSSLLTLITFVHQLTGFKPDLAVNLTEEELRFGGPLPTVPQKTADYVLVLSTTFLLFTCIYLIVKSSIISRFFEWIRNAWRGAQQHQHQD